jgi:hypothetical protein
VLPFGPVPSTHRDGKRRLPRVALAASVGVVVLGLAGYLFLRPTVPAAPDGNGTTQPSPTTATPDFAFTLTSVEPLGTNPEPSEVDAGDAADAVTAAVSRLYTEAFLDSANWGTAQYESVWSLFDEGAAEAGRADLEVLTAGSAASDRFTRIDPIAGEIAVTLLLDDTGEPSIAVASVTFEARATAVDGQVTDLISSGSYFLRSTPQGWMVFSFRVDRDDRDASAPAEASPTPETS